MRVGWMRCFRGFGVVWRVRALVSLGYPFIYARVITASKTRQIKVLSLQTFNIPASLPIVPIQLPNHTPLPEPSLLPGVILLLKSPPPRLIQAQRILPRLRLAAQTLLLAVAIHVVAAQELGALLLLAEQGTQSAARGAAEGVAEGAGDAFFEGRAEGAEAGV